MYSFFEMYHLLEALPDWVKKNSAAAMSHEPDDRAHEPAFIPSQQTDSAADRTRADHQRAMAQNAEIDAAYQGSKKPATSQPPTPQKPAIKTGGEDYEGKVPLKLRKTGVRPSDQYAQMDPEDAAALKAQRSKRNKVGRLPDQLADFNDKWSRNVGYHDYALAKAKELGYDIPPEISHPHTRLRLAVKPSGQEGEIVVSPKDAQAIMRHSSDMMSARRDDVDDSVGYQGHFRDDLAKTTKKQSPEEQFTNSLALKIDDLFTKHQLKMKTSPLFQQMPIGEFVRTVGEYIGRTPDEVLPSLKKLMQVAPFLFDWQKENGTISAKPQGKAGDREHQTVFSKPEPIRQRSGQGAAVSGFPGRSKPEPEVASEGPEAELRDRWSKEQGAMNSLLMQIQDGDVRKADVLASKLEDMADALEPYTGEDWAEDIYQELIGFHDELEKLQDKHEWSDLDTWVHMDQLVESHWGAY